MSPRAGVPGAWVTVGIDVVAALAALSWALRIRFGAWLPGTDLVSAEHALLFAFVLPAWWSASAMVASSSRRWRSLASEIPDVLAIGVLGGLGLAAFAFAFKLASVSRAVVALQWWLYVLLALGLRWLGRTVLGSLRKRGVDARYVLVVGEGDSARRFMADIAAHPELGLVVAGCFGGDDPAEVERIFAQRVIDEVVVAAGCAGVELWAPPGRWDSLIDRCREQGKSVRVLLDQSAVAARHYRVDDWYGTPVLSFEFTPSHRWQLLAKRLIDLAGATAGLVLLAPLFVMVALAIKVTSPDGPVFFVQRRVGLNGRQFPCIKFRTMVPDAEMRKAALLRQNEMSGPVFKMRNDPRVTPIGRFLRRTSIDELPQLINVLLGHMSLVGPRPEVPEEVATYTNGWRRRLSVKPGITGLWQVSGRMDLDYTDRWRLDLQYIDQWSLWADIRILIATIPAVTWGRGAY